MNSQQTGERARHDRWARWLAFLVALTAVVKATGIDPQPLDAMLPPVSAGLFGAFLVQLIITARPGNAFGLELLATLGGAALVTLGWSLGFPESWEETSFLVGVGTSLGVGSLAVVSTRVALGGAAQAPSRDALPLAVALVCGSIVIAFFTTLTVAVFPRTLDAWTFAADAAFGGHLDFALGRLLQAAPPLRWLAGLVYDGSIATLVVVYAFQRRRAGAAPVDVFSAGLALTLVGVALYFVFPVVGATYLWPQLFPLSPPLDVKLAAMAVPPFVPAAGSTVLGSLARNCMPSLHFAWALLALAHTRGLHASLRWVGAAWLGLTALATLGFGYHYLVDLIVAVPVTVVAQALVLPSGADGGRARWQALAFGAATTVTWLLLIRFGTAVLLLPGLAWLLAIATIAGAVVLEARAWRAALDAPPRPATASADAPPLPGLRSLIAIFFVSGAAALVYEVVFARKLGLVFGNTATANTTVLATYMGGMALGSWLGGLVAVRAKRPLVLYAFAEVAVGVYCLVSPPLFDAVQALFVSLASGAEAGAGWIVAVQFALGASVLLPPTLLMGATLPLLAHERRSEDAEGRVAGLLYAANTFGAAVGALVTGYVLLPSLGVSNSTLVAVAANLLAGLLAYNLAKNTAAAQAPGVAQEPATVRPLDATHVTPHRRIGLLVLGVGGISTLAMENVAIHLLATVVGSSAYAFTLMLFTFLVGLGLGSAVGNRLLRLRWDALVSLGLLQAGMAASLLLGVYFWESVPSYFEGFEGYPLGTTFGAREFLRFGVCLVALLPPTLFIGASWPLAMHCATSAEHAERGRAVGRAMALNTVGNIAGALVGGFVAIPLLGSLRSLHVVAAAASLLGLLALWKAGARARPAFAGALAVVALLGGFQPRDFDWKKLATGANVYFQRSEWGDVIDHAESLAGGITTVTQTKEGTRFLLTNGKFQGQWPGEEMKAQYGCTLVPLLHTPARGRAVVIGYGTGASALAAQEAGFEHVDVVDLTRDIVELADKHFPECSGGVSSRPRVAMHYTDGRNFLALSREKYDLIGLEISSIWFAGAAALYNREFYALAKDRLAPGGVLQQWFQLHHLSRTDLLSIFETAHQEFEQLWIYVTGGQGVLVACNGDCAPNERAKQAMASNPALAKNIALWGGLEPLAQTLVLTPEDYAALRAEAERSGVSLEALVSDDDNLLLEYATPRGNARDGRLTGQANIDMLLRFSKQPQRATAPP